MALIPSSPNEWPQTQQNNQIDDQKGDCLNSTITNNNNMGSLGALVMDQKVVPITQNHQEQEQQKQQNQEALRCPRCDSSNTKFCYYNNYSLSQPRHFCKACKRYWTRGGTLRNVPVGGGCRKNKRVKIRPPNLSSSNSTSTNSATNNSSGISLQNNTSIHDNHHVHNNPLFFGMPTNSHDINFPFSRYDLQNPSQIHALGLGFSSSSSGLIHSMNGLSFNVHNNNTNNPTSKQIFQDLISNSSNSNPLISSSHYTNNPTNSPTISSLLASTLQMKGAAGNNFQTLLPSYEDDLQMKASSNGGMFMKDEKMELEGQNRNLDQDHHSWSTLPSQNHHQGEDQSSSDPSLLWGGGANNLGAWLDSSNSIGSSVPSLI